MVSVPRFVLRLLPTALLIAAFGVQCARAATPGEYEVKAAFLYNFARFVDWPEETAATDLALCVLGTDPFGPALDALAGKEVQGRRLSVRRIDSGGDWSACHMLFVPESEQSRLDTLLGEFAAHHGILSVSDINGFAGRGGIIELVLDQNRVRFAINVEAATRAGLTVSSKLLRLAEGVN